MQKLFEKKHINDKKYCKFREHYHYASKYRRAAHNICNLKYSIPKKIPAVFHNGSNYYYHFFIKELAKELEGEFNYLGENTDKTQTFSVPITKEVKIIGKNGEKTTKLYPTNYNFLIGQDLFQAHYQILLIILLKEFLKLNENMVMITTTNARRVKLDINIVCAVLNTRMLKMI